MKLRNTIFPVWAMIFALCSSVEAQQPGKVVRIGYLDASTASGSAVLVDAFRQELSKLGWIEGKNLTIEYRFAKQKFERLPELAADLARLKVDLIVGAATPPAVAAKKATQTIPIITVTTADPVGSRLVASLAHPGGNVTGLSLVPGLEMSGKQLELLKEAVPKLNQVAVLIDPGNEPTARFLKEAEKAASSLVLHLRAVEAGNADELNSAFSAINEKRPDALLVIASPILSANRTQIARFATSSRLPAMYPYSEFVDAGGLMSYGPHQPDLYRRAATYVDKILKGADPANLPIDQPTKFELVINLKTAKALNLTIPQSVLYRADKVIR